MDLRDLFIGLFSKRTKNSVLRVENSKNGKHNLKTNSPVDAEPVMIRINNSETPYKLMPKPEAISVSMEGSTDVATESPKEVNKPIESGKECKKKIDTEQRKNPVEAKRQDGGNTENPSVLAMGPKDQSSEESEPAGEEGTGHISGENQDVSTKSISLVNPLSFCFMSEKKADNGEDSDPLLLIKDSFAVVGVFDGMGGAGSAMHVMGGDEKTGAYFASRKVKQATESFFAQLACDKNNSIIQSDTIADDLKTRIKSAFDLLRKECPPKVKSGLKSAMIKEFPTTLSVALLQRTDNARSVVSLWAGDSRNYLLTSKGLFQISIDDLEAKGDPFENLSSDSPLSNQICADRDFVINKLLVDIKEDQFVVFSATDGCFGYYPTPLHFEDALLRNLSKATTEQDWMQFLKEEFHNVAADDTSMSCVIYGFDDFNALKNSLIDRTHFVECKIHDYDEQKLKIDDAKALVAKYEESFKSYKQSVWNEYRVDYMSFIS